MSPNAPMTAAATPILLTAATPRTLAIRDAGRVRLGAGMKPLPSPTPARVADSGRVRLGAGMRRA